MKLIFLLLLLAGLSSMAQQHIPVAYAVDSEPESDNVKMAKMAAETVVSAAQHQYFLSVKVMDTKEMIARLEADAKRRDREQADFQYKVNLFVKDGHNASQSLEFVMRLNEREAKLAEGIATLASDRSAFTARAWLTAPVALAVGFGLGYAYRSKI